MTTITAPRTFDERRAEKHYCLCQRWVTGTCRAVLPVQCRYWREPVRGGRFGALMVNLDVEEGE